MQRVTLWSCLCLATMALPVSVMAQQNARLLPEPVSQPVAASSAVHAKEEPSQRDTGQLGNTTRRLMAAQASGTQAPLPTLGVTASQALDRYLESFRHPLPEWFQQHVEAIESR